MSLRAWVAVAQLILLVRSSTLFPAESSLAPVEEFCLVSDGFSGEVDWGTASLSDHAAGDRHVSGW